MHKSIQKHLAYRTATIAGLVTNLFFGMLRAAVMVALYGSRTAVTGISVADAITYTGVTQAIIGFLSLFSWYELMNSVYTGAIASDLVKPIDYYKYWVAQDCGRAMVQLVLRGVPIMALYAIIFDVTLPASAGQWMAFIVSMVLAWFISFSWRFLLNLSSFWVPNAVGLLRFGFILSWFFSGFLMPLRFFPDWFLQVCYLTPFPHMINTVVEIYLGLLTGADITRVILLQIFWSIVLLVSGQLILRAGIRRLVILGG